jgi:hypothetical protein
LRHLQFVLDGPHPSVSISLSQIEEEVHTVVSLSCNTHPFPQSSARVSFVRMASSHPLHVHALPEQQRGARSAVVVSEFSVRTLTLGHTRRQELEPTTVSWGFLWKDAIFRRRLAVKPRRSFVDVLESHGDFSAARFESE